MAGPEPDDLHQHPRVLVARACAVYGTAAVAAWCADLLAGRVAPDDPQAPHLTWIGKVHAATLLRRGDLSGQEHWPRVWAARALRYAWAPGAAGAVVGGLSDPAWRVREMAAGAVLLRELGEAAERLAELTGDPVARVRAAALRALGEVGEAEHGPALRAAREDADPAVRRAAEAALARLRLRLDRAV
jgi:HEAT repeat protein